ncbi:MAG TPA: ATP-binding protein, partial [Segetibacter sp.]
YTPDEAIGQKFEILFPDFLRDENFPEKEVQLAKETGRYETENWRRKKNGELFWAHVVLTRITDEEGDIVGYVKITQDQTDKKQALNNLNNKVEEISNINQKLDNLNYDLTTANSSLEQFTYASSHDLQAPLRRITYFFDRLKDEIWDKLTDRQINFFNRIDDSISRMSALIDDLLTFSQISKGSGQLQQIDLNEKIKTILQDLELDISEKKAKIVVDKLPIVVGNSGQLQQLFENLISNSIKYTKPGIVPLIEISSREVTGNEVNKKPANLDANKKYYLIELKDNGIGFEQEYAEQIFQVFTRLHDNSEYAGTGIGLSIVQKVVENHNGHIWAESTVGEGASFKILLPIGKV